MWTMTNDHEQCKKLKKHVMMTLSSAGHAPSTYRALICGIALWNLVVKGHVLFVKYYGMLL